MASPNRRHTLPPVHVLDVVVPSFIRGIDEELH